MTLTRAEMDAMSAVTKVPALLDQIEVQLGGIEGCLRALALMELYGFGPGGTTEAEELRSQVLTLLEDR